jgi:hypothetical protein
LARFGHQVCEAPIPVSELLTGECLIDGNERGSSHIACDSTETLGTFVP